MRMHSFDVACVALVLVCVGQPPSRRGRAGGRVGGSGDGSGRGMTKLVAVGQVCSTTRPTRPRPTFTTAISEVHPRLLQAPLAAIHSAACRCPRHARRSRQRAACRRYVGDVESGKRNGHGVYYYDSGDKYTGSWVMGKQEGHGVYVYANGDRYVGNWRGGKHSGEGTYYFKSGKVFQGSYINGSPSGHGVFIYTNGEKLDGEVRQQRAASPPGGLRAVKREAVAAGWRQRWQGGTRHAAARR